MQSPVMEYPTAYHMKKNSIIISKTKSPTINIDSLSSPKGKNYVVCLNSNDIISKEYEGNTKLFKIKNNKQKSILENYNKSIRTLYSTTTRHLEKAKNHFHNSIPLKQNDYSKNFNDPKQFTEKRKKDSSTINSFFLTNKSSVSSSALTSLHKKNKSQNSNIGSPREEFNENKKLNWKTGTYCGLRNIHKIVSPPNPISPLSAAISKCGRRTGEFRSTRNHSNISIKNKSFDNSKISQNNDEIEKKPEEDETNTKMPNKFITNKKILSMKFLRDSSQDKKPTNKFKKFNSSIIPSLPISTKCNSLQWKKHMKKYQNSLFFQDFTEFIGNNPLKLNDKQNENAENNKIIKTHNKNISEGGGNKINKINKINVKIIPNKRTNSQPKNEIIINEPVTSFLTFYKNKTNGPPIIIESNKANSSNQLNISPLHLKKDSKSGFLQKSLSQSTWNSRFKEIKSARTSMSPRKGKEQNKTSYDWRNTFYSDKNSKQLSNTIYQCERY
jgi:hypothetical protein